MSARVVTAYSLVFPPGGPRARGSIGTLGDERLEAFGHTLRGERDVTDLAAWAPQAFGHMTWDNGDFAVDGRAPVYTIISCRTYFMTFPHSGEVLVLDREFDGGIDEIILAERDAFDPLVEKTLGGIGLLTAARSSAPEPIRSFIQPLTFGQDKHQLLFVDGQHTSLVFGPDGDPATSHDLRRVMFKDTDLNYDPAETPISLPQDINGLDGLTVAVWGSNTVAAGLEPYGELGRRRQVEMLEGSGQIVAAMACVRRVRSEALGILSSMSGELRSGTMFQPQQDVRQVRGTVRETFAQLSSLDLELSFGAEVYVGPLLVRGGRPLERYQEAVRYEMGFDEAVTMSGDLMERISRIARKVQESFEAEILLQNADRQSELLDATTKLLSRTTEAKTAAIVAGVVLATVSMLALFATFAAIPTASKNVWVTPTIRSGAVASLLVMLAAGYGLCVRAAASARLDARLHRPVGVAAGLFGAVSLAALALSASGHDFARGRFPIATLVMGLVFAATSLLLWCWRGTYE